MVGGRLLTDEQRWQAIVQLHVEVWRRQIRRFSKCGEPSVPKVSADG